MPTSTPPPTLTLEQKRSLYRDGYVVLKARKPGDHFNNVGYRDRDMPYYGAETHVDGMITMMAPKDVQQGTGGDLPALLRGRPEGRPRA